MVRATRRVAYRSLHVHITLGYPGLKFLPDLQRFRADYPAASPAWQHRRMGCEGRHGGPAPTTAPLPLRWNEQYR